MALANSAPKEPEARKLKKGEIEYLAFEGGGGKGFAYLGAIDMLERIGVMGDIKGFAGASAGAITALLLSIGYDFKALNTFLGETDFDSFYDPPRPRVRPEVGTSGAQVSSDSVAERQFINGDINAWLQALLQGDSSSTLKTLLSAFAASQAGPLIELLGRSAGQLVGRLADLSRLKSSISESLQVKAPPPEDLPVVASVLLASANYYFAYLPRDMGLFSGQAARILFDSLLAKAAAKRQHSLPSAYANITFQEHKEIFKKSLLVSGTNLRSGRTQLFSKKDTPHFPVADAVRISMGLPWVFKPYVIRRRNDKKDPPCGVYVDGGVWNNLPFREFDSNPPEDKPASSAAVSPKRTDRHQTPRTLGLRLEIEPAATIDSVFGITVQMLKRGLLGSGESQVLDKYVDQCILLDTRGLDLLSFSPPKDKNLRQRILNRSRRAVCRYFDWDVDLIQPSIKDDDDDLQTDKARKAAETCDPN